MHEPLSKQVPTKKKSKKKKRSDDIETEDSEQEDISNRRKNKRQKQKAIYESSSDSEYGDQINEDPQINLSPEKDPSKDIFHLFKTVSGINDLDKKQDKIDPFYRKSEKK